jgi:hypothetical protein
MRTATILKWLGAGWLVALALIVVGGEVAFIVLAGNRWRALQEVAAQYSPYNVGAVVFKLILAAPGLFMLWLAARLQRKRHRGQRERASPTDP